MELQDLAFSKQPFSPVHKKQILLQYFSIFQTEMLYRKSGIMRSDGRATEAPLQ